MHRRLLPGFVLIAVLIGACSNSAQSPTTLVHTRGTQTLNLELRPGGWEESELAAKTSGDFSVYMLEELTFVPGDCQSKVLIHRFDHDTRWADGRIDSLCSEASSYVVWRPQGEDSWTKLRSLNNLHPRCQMLQVADVSVEVYAGNLALGKCRTKKLVAYADFLTETD